MRVIAGTAKRTLLKSPKGKGTRPTADRVKESVFNILAPRVAGCCFLDLFSGTGAIAIEALSRGAEKAVLVEKDPRNIRIIKENLHITRLSDNAQIYAVDVFKALKILRRENRKFDIIYMDPPYKAGYYEKVLEDIVDSCLLATGGLLVVESSSKEVLPEKVINITNIRTQKYGDTLVSFYQ
ncbi:MAG: 16S rRNA (guanine(966)-N(2))-methyltransferase RsmD [Desulfotomaculum sp.]|nr:16S rRNA (guanine(966)-N(2))-methyltransferase RsmD [Desulfotomaculum sp.]